MISKPLYEDNSQVGRERADIQTDQKKTEQMEELKRKQREAESLQRQNMPAKK